MLVLVLTLRAISEFMDIWGFLHDWDWIDFCGQVYCRLGNMARALERQCYLMALFKAHIVRLVVPLL